MKNNLAREILENTPKEIRETTILYHKLWLEAKESGVSDTQACNYTNEQLKLFKKHTIKEIQTGTCFANTRKKINKKRHGSKYPRQKSKFKARRSK